ncbi:hypothetical protein TNCV_734431 [Trichonephila clavipes]|nr:hypothetical protein TNCV_734431 [Trichonephila clavipes]
MLHFALTLTRISDTNLGPSPRDDLSNNHMINHCVPQNDYTFRFSNAPSKSVKESSDAQDQEIKNSGGSSDMEENIFANFSSSFQKREIVDENQASRTSLEQKKAEKMDCYPDEGGHNSRRSEK